MGVYPERAYRILGKADPQKRIGNAKAIKAKKFCFFTDKTPLLIKNKRNSFYQQLKMLIKRVPLRLL
jgi:hypothetical protein